MGERGPIPKRSDERARRNAPEREVVKADGAKKVPIPAADRNWHPIAKRLWNAMKKSGQAVFYEPSDWAVAYSLMDDLSYYKNQHKRSGQMLAAIMAALTSLMLTEGDRRRLQIELFRQAADEERLSAGQAEANEWQARLTAVK